MILFVGQIAREMRGREAFQELDYRAVFGTLAKWATEIDDAARIPEIISRAFFMATSGRPGPVVIALPEDMLVDRVTVPDAPAFAPVESSPGPAEMERLPALIAGAKRPIMIAGGSRWSEAAVAELTRFSERFAMPVATSFRRAMLFDQLHPNYAGDLGIGANPKLVEYIKSSDLVMLIGGRLGEMPSQRYSLLDIPSPRQTFVHVHPGAEELGRVYQPALAINAAPTGFAAALDRLAPPTKAPRADDAKALHAAYLGWTDKATKVPGGVNLGEVIVSLRDQLPADAVVTNGAGNFSVWVHRYHRFRRYGTQLAPIAGSMGYGVPAAIAAKRLMPERTVVAFAGDGDFLMTGQEFATAVQHDLPVIIIVCDNGMYGTIRMHQEREYPGHVVGTSLRNPDFAALARAYGGFGATVETTAGFMPAFEAARASGQPAILHLKIDPQAITPATTLDAIRTKALAEHGG
jgi:acetolactate synthase-1/2/3 large subunit